jgi:DNA-binding MarR family transcriptional regulator
MISKAREKAELSQAEAYQIWGLLGQVNNGLFRTRDNEARPLGVSATQLGLLAVLRTMHLDGLAASPSELSHWLCREPSTTTSLLNRMEKQGLVKLVRTSSGKRRVLVQATDKGKEVCRRDLQRTQAIQRIMGCLSVRERKQIESILHKLRKKTFEELAEEPPYL